LFFSRPAALSVTARRRRRHRFYALLLLVTVLVMVTLALPTRLSRFGAVGYNLTTLLMVAELEGSTRHGGRRFREDDLYRLLGVSTLIAQWFWYLTPLSNRVSGWPLLVLTTLFVGWSLVRLVGFLAEEKRVNARVLMGAVSGYLLLGLMAGLLFTALETIVPGSFVTQQDQTAVLQGQVIRSSLDPLVWQLDFTRLNYFAFVSLTTVGYGDVLPSTPMAQMAAISVSVIGPIYMAVVMGLLIGRFTTGNAATAAGRRGSNNAKDSPED
jgi:voltage-gated potassium channel Kch